jgi:hypothetical protein
VSGVKSFILALVSDFLILMMYMAGIRRGGAPVIEHRVCQLIGMALCIVDHAVESI